MKRPVLLDLYCGAGGASWGYYLAGFSIVGLDLVVPKTYPFPSIQANALAAGWKGFDAYHASPPCQLYSTSTHITGTRAKHQSQIEDIRDLLRAADKPYVIENVPKAPLINPAMLCGSMFGLEVRRHRKFESNLPIAAPSCDHAAQPEIVGVHGHPGGKSSRGDRKHTLEDWKRAMGIDWMSGRQLAQAIPPAYTRYIGLQILQHMK